MTASRKPYYTAETLSHLEEARSAIARHDYQALQAIMASGLNPNIPGADGRYLVHDAILNDASGTSVDILVHYHADVNVRWASYLGWTPAHIACYAGRRDVVEKLRMLGADLKLADTRGWQATHTLPCPITRIEARRKFGGFSSLVGTHEKPMVFA